MTKAEVADELGRLQQLDKDIGAAVTAVYHELQRIQGMTHELETRARVAGTTLARLRREEAHG